MSNVLLSSKNETCKPNADCVHAQADHAILHSHLRNYTFLWLANTVRYHRGPPWGLEYRKRGIYYRETKGTTFFNDLALEMTNHDCIRRQILDHLSKFFEKIN